MKRKDIAALLDRARAHQTAAEDLGEEKMLDAALVEAFFAGSVLLERAPQVADPGFPAPADNDDSQYFLRAGLKTLQLSEEDRALALKLYRFWDFGKYQRPVVYPCARAEALAWVERVREAFVMLIAQRSS